MESFCKTLNKYYKPFIEKSTYPPAGNDQVVPWECSYYLEEDHSYNSINIYVDRNDSHTVEIIWAIVANDPTRHSYFTYDDAATKTDKELVIRAFNTWLCSLMTTTHSLKD